MKQVIQNLRNGELTLADVPCPQVSRGHVLIQTHASLISAGTERSLVEFSRASLVSKARQQPDRVQQVIEKIQSDGLLPTLEAVFARLDQPLPLGYCNAGRIVEIGPDVGEFKVGQRVVSNGPHAEMVHVPVNLCAHIPDCVPDDHAAFTVLSSIGLQGIRLLSPSLGESVVVYGLGLVGLLSVQMLIAAGIRVLGVDLDPGRLRMAEQFGAETVNGSDVATVLAASFRFSRGHGVDGVLIAAAARNDDIVHQAAEMSRKRGRLVLVGDVNLQLQRADFYEKELSIQVSCSYGPGRYDPNYEQEGQDYPLPFVRWTEQRNLESVLGMMSTGQLDVESLINSRFAQSAAKEAYDCLTEDKSQLGIVLQYPNVISPRERTLIRRTGATTAAAVNGVKVGIIGAGAFTQRVLLPQLKRLGVRVVGIASASGVSASHAAKKFGIESCTSDYRTILENKMVNTVFITTRHHLHASMTIAALEAGKHVFVEKPAAIREQELAEVRHAYDQASVLQYLVGFNRRFAPHAVKMHQLLATRSAPICGTVLINAGQVPADNWNHDPQVGGGRIVGEVCHWIDLMTYLVGHPISKVYTTTIGIDSGNPLRNDHVAVSLNFTDGSLANIQYYANGPRKFPKERIEVFCQQRALQLDNFRALYGFGWPDFRKLRFMRQDKGHCAEFSQFIHQIELGGKPLIPPAELWCVSQATIAAQQSAVEGQPIEIEV